ncbi:hypothetical protein [Mucilaginibacter psychrotolerans]|uniref:Uncharacterized protein n=1 Tax=Mucilaginibacter psychrotolerans TaxID=1524096 RepID=A0A4Y8SKK5_9SPHI|nr:hypothetical protein [Mucilaginibacter psychrotolerans]TFF39201.1 hypothetical protein E2R66_06155 [Mucilaginibacter psychrotolerans]
MTTAGPYTIAYDGYVLTVREAYIKGRRIFNVQFSIRIKPINLTVVDNGKGFKFWTSIPEGRQAIADEIGPVIGRYYHDKKNK